MAYRTEAELLAERDLIEAAKRDRAAFAPLYERYVDQIFTYVLTMTRDQDLAEDVTASTFARAIEDLPRFEYRGVPYSAWLYRVATNLVHRQRRRRPALELDPGLPSAAPGPDELAEVEERAAAVREAVADLPRDQREAVALRFGGELCNKEIADLMGRSEGAVKLLTFRALTTLRRRLGAPLPAERAALRAKVGERGIAPMLGVLPSAAAAPRDGAAATAAPRQADVA